MQLNFRTKVPAVKEIRELVQDLIQMFAPIAETRLVEVTAPYTTGMLLQLPRAPKAIVLVRCFNPKAPTVVGTFTGAVDFAWNSSQSAAQILSIRGMSPAATTYNFTFQVVYE